ncbi:MAG: hypothetical protein U0529_08985 [Thermoanaerobaculia bacterium]
MEEIRIVHGDALDRKPAASRIGLMFSLWAGMVLVIFGAVSGRRGLALLLAGVAFLLFVFRGFRRLGKKVCPGCREAIAWDAATCPACQRDVP